MKKTGMRTRMGIYDKRIRKGNRKKLRMRIAVIKRTLSVRKQERE